MNKIAPPIRMNRRSFLTQMAVMAGSLLLPSKVQTWAAPTNEQHRTVGVLLPPSSVYPALGESFVAGMRLYFDQAAAESVDLHVENVTFSAASAVQKARALIEGRNVDVVAGILSESTARRLRDLFEAAKIPLIASGIGANVTPPEAQSDFVTHNILDYWQSSYTMGTWAAEHIGKRAVVAASLYESGYDAYNAFRLGFEAQGGQILCAQTTHVSDAADGLDTFFETVNATTPDFVYAAYAGKEAFDFVTAYANTGLSTQIPLIGSGFLTDETFLPALGEAAVGIKTCLPWSAALDTPENAFFTTAYAQHTGRPANVFALLGFEAARLISPSKTNVSPMKARTLTIREVRQQAGVFHNVPIATLPRIDAFDNRFATLRSSLKTGWLNAYLSV